MPTVLPVGPYRFFFSPVTARNRLTSTSSATTVRPNSGSTLSGSSAAAASSGRRSTGSEIWSWSTESSYWRAGMSSFAVEPREALATAVTVTEDTLSVELADGRTIAAPLAWYPRLAHATAKERGSWRLIAGGRGIHWPGVDEDIS